MCPFCEVHEADDFHFFWVVLFWNDETSTRSNVIQGITRQQPTLKGKAIVSAFTPEALCQCIGLITPDAVPQNEIAPEFDGRIVSGHYERAD
jgi:hypothetical protein